LLVCLLLQVGIDSGGATAEVHATTGRMSYRGKVMNRAARIGSSASSGQMLCSGEAFAEAVVVSRKRVQQQDTCLSRTVTSTSALFGTVDFTSTRPSPARPAVQDATALAAAEDVQQPWGIHGMLLGQYQLKVRAA
jgi:hypothetical protein